MAVITDTFHEMLQSDGEGITDGDMNDMQRFALARLFDQVIEEMAPPIDTTSVDMEFNENANAGLTTFVYTLNPGRAYAVQGTANNKIKISAGTVLQKIASADGSEPKFVPYTFGGTDEVTIANGDATHPRVDIVQIKLEYVSADVQTRDFQDAVTGAASDGATDKKREVQCTISVKQGVPAVSPAYPVPDAGYAMLFGVVVGTLYVAAAGFKFSDTAGATAVIHDQRVPLRVRAYRVDAKDWIHDGTWTTNGPVIQSGAAATETYCFCSGGGLVGRLLAIELASGNMPAGSTAELFRGKFTTGVTLTNIATASGAISYAAFSASLDHVVLRDFFLQSVSLPEAGPTISRSVGPPYYGAPIWTSGVRGPYKNQALEGFPRQMSRLGLRVDPNGTAGGKISHATFYVLEGL